MLDRKHLYLSWIKDSLDYLLNFQDRRVNSPTNGCFFYSQWKGKEKYSNARWQEAVFALSWVYKREPGEELKQRVEAGIDYWCRLQHHDGSFPEYSRYDRSFAATAFSTYAVLMAGQVIGMKEGWWRYLDKAGQWLCANNERYLANQEAMAALTLLRLYNSLGRAEFLKAAEEKLEFVLKFFSEKGFFRENNGFDLGYSSLTLSLLGNYYLERKDERIWDVAEKCIPLLSKFIYPDGSFGGTYNSRKIGWIIFDGLEIFSSRIAEARKMLRHLFQGHLGGVGNIAHLPNPRHLCTDLYRFCQAHDHTVTELEEEDITYKRGREILPELGLEIVRVDRYIAITDLNNCHLYSLWTPDGIKVFFKGPGKGGGQLLNLLRPLGLHRLRGLKYLFVKAPLTRALHALSPLGRGKGKGRYEFFENEIKVCTDLGEEEFLFAYTDPYVIEKEKTQVILKGQRNTFTISTDDYLCLEDMGKISVEDSIFYGNRALSFLRIKIGSSSHRPLEYVLKIT